MKNTITLLLLLASFITQAQKGISGLISAERSFASYAAVHGTKDAFLQYLDSTGIVFEKGQPVNGIESWNKKAKREGLLAWHPQFAEIAASGDFGYTSGPWTFQPKTSNDSIIAHGQYNTVWHQNNKGEWKFLLDVGTAYPAINESKDLEKTIVHDKMGKADLLSMLHAEESFIKAYTMVGVAAYKNIISSQQTILNRNGYLPALTEKAQTEILKGQPKDLQFTIKDSGIAISGDLGYVYGISTSGNKSEGYLHIWRKERENWKLALEVLQY